LQFTVIIEFLIPGLATLLIGMALLPSGTLPPPPEGLPSGDTAAALLLLAISYPVGHLVNFPVFFFLQQRRLVPRARRRLVAEYMAKGIDLEKRVRQLLGFERPEGSADARMDPGELFRYLRAVIYSKNVERLNENHLYHQGLQRLARGMLVPLVMAAFLVLRDDGWLRVVLLPILGSFFIVCLELLIHSINKDEEQMVDLFLVLSAPETKGGPPAT
jgi:hypothetical protein